MSQLQDCTIIDGICKKIFYHLKGNDALNFAIFLSLNGFVGTDTENKIVCRCDIRNNLQIQEILPKFDLQWNYICYDIVLNICNIEYEYINEKIIDVNKTTYAEICNMIRQKKCRIEVIEEPIGGHRNFDHDMEILYENRYEHFIINHLIAKVLLSYDKEIYESKPVQMIGRAMRESRIKNNFTEEYLGIQKMNQRKHKYRKLKNRKYKK